jgi:hypothetical protein
MMATLTWERLKQAGRLVDWAKDGERKHDAAHRELRRRWDATSPTPTESEPLDEGLE